MNKRNKFMGTIIVLLVIGMLATSLSLASATPPTAVSGYWVGGKTTLIDRYWNGPNMVQIQSLASSYVSGPIMGSFQQYLTSTSHYGDPKLAKELQLKDPSLYPETDFSWKIERTFSGTVNGKTGTLAMHLICKGYGNPAKGVTFFDVEGTWVIISGTGDLTNLHGQGTWWYSRAKPYIFNYEGQIHFDP